MRFEIDDTFAATVEELEALLDEPELYPRMARALPNIERIELLDEAERDGVMRRRVRYTPSREAAERIPAIARGRLRPEMMVWVEESCFWRSEHRLEYSVTAAGWRAGSEERGDRARAGGGRDGGAAADQGPAGELSRRGGYFDGVAGGAEKPLSGQSAAGS